MGHPYLSEARKTRVASVGIAATVSLYLLVVFIAEPLRSFAATTANTVVTYSITSALSLTCDATSTTGTAPGNGTTAFPTGTGAMAVSNCTPIANNSLGYTLSWLISSSTGSTSPVCTGNCYGTGHLLSNNVTAGKPDVIKAFTPRLANRPERFDSTSIGTGSGSRWAARLQGTSSTTGGASVTWGADGQTSLFLNVATGSAVNVAKRTTATAAVGDVENFMYKVIIPSTAFQPTGTYKATIVYTVTDN